MPERLTKDPGEVAEARAWRAVESVDRAKQLLLAAIDDLTGLTGMERSWERVCRLYELVRDAWDRLDEEVRKARYLTLDALDAANLKMGGGAPAVLRPHAEQIHCPGLGYRPCCSLPVRSRYAIAQELAEALVRAWRVAGEPIVGSTMSREAAALYALEKDVVRLTAELDGRCERCASEAAFFSSDTARNGDVPEQRKKGGADAP